MSIDGFSNAYSTTLNGSITNVATSLVVTSATGAPSTVPFRLRIKAEGGNTTEIVTVTAVAGTTYTITRASESYAGVQTASAHASGATVEHILTAASLLTVSTMTVLSDDFNRANGSVGDALNPIAPWFPSLGTWDINSNRLRETSAGSERFIIQNIGYRRGTRTIVWTMNTKPSSGDGGLFWRSTWDVSGGLLINVEATYKLYVRASVVYTAATVASGSPATPANGDIITVVDTGNRVTISVNGGASVVYDSVVLTSEGPHLGFRNSGGSGMTHDSIVVTES